MTTTTSTADLVTLVERFCTLLEKAPQRFELGPGVLGQRYLTWHREAEQLYLEARSLVPRR